MIKLFPHSLKMSIRDGHFVKYSFLMIGVLGYMNDISFFSVAVLAFFYKDFLTPLFKDDNTFIRLRITNTDISKILLANNLVFVFLLNFWDILAKIMASILYVVLWNTEKLMSIWQIKSFLSFNLMAFLLIFAGNFLALSDIITAKFGSNHIQMTILLLVFCVVFFPFIFLQNIWIIIILLAIMLSVWYIHAKKYTTIPYFTHYLDN